MAELLEGTLDAGQGGRNPVWADETMVDVSWGHALFRLVYFLQPVVLGFAVIVASVFQLSAVIGLSDAPQLLKMDVPMAPTNLGNQ